MSRQLWGCRSKNIHSEDPVTRELEQEYAAFVDRKFALPQQWDVGIDGRVFRDRSSTGRRGNCSNCHILNW